MSSQANVPDRSCLLAVDIGNTNIHLGIWYEGEWRYNWRARTVHDKMPDEYAALIRNFLRDREMNFDSISDVVIASVVPSLTTAFAELSLTYIEVDPLIVSSQINTGIKVDVDHPEMVGADRIVNAAAVHRLYGGPAIVIDFGTATTFDVVAVNGDYIGGSIAPGIGISLDALVGRTAQLYKVKLEPPANPIGRNTSEAIQSGMFWGYVGLVEGLVARIRAALPATPEVKIIATGGLAPLFRQHTNVIQAIAPYLTLDGMRIIYDLNR
ncbi:MAG: type III pantothenate kinase [Anaerolineae bacterium]|nr:type III pantothenate kinase [Anaerolineae bacterium]